MALLPAAHASVPHIDGPAGILPHFLHPLLAHPVPDSGQDTPASTQLRCFEESMWRSPSAAPGASLP